MDAAFRFLPFGLRLDGSLLLGWEAVRERAVGVVTLVLISEMDEGYIRIQEPTTLQQGIHRSLFQWTCADFRDDKGGGGMLAS